MHWEELHRIAKKELEEEERRKIIQEIKDKLRQKKELPWHVKYFPYRIKIYRVDQ
jgi:hypothetical protein